MYYTSHMTKINKLIILELDSIIQKCIENQMNANTTIQKLGNFFLMFIKWLFNLLFILCFLYYSSQTYQFITTFYLGKRTFMLKPQVALNQLQANSTNIMCLSIIKTYINCPNHYESLSLSNLPLFITYIYIYAINPKLLSV
jgi:hypothetical protein